MDTNERRPEATEGPARRPRTERTGLSRVVRACVLVVASLVAPGLAAQHGPPPVTDGAAQMDSDKLGQKAVLDLPFVDEQGRAVRLDELVTGERPAILNLGFYQCPGICSTVLNNLLALLTDAELRPGRDFDLITVSFDHEETPELAFQKRESYVREVARLHGGRPQSWTDAWRFLTGAEEDILALTSSVGWNFRYNTRNRVFHDHPPVLVVLSPDGTITQHISPNGIAPRTLRRAVIEASDGRVGSPLERLLVTCLTYDPTTGKYTMTAMTVMKIGGVLFVLALSIFLLFLWRRERARSAAAPDTAALSTTASH